MKRCRDRLAIVFNSFCKFEVPLVDGHLVNSDFFYWPRNMLPQMSVV